MSEHRFPDNLSAKACAVCENGCGTIARQVAYKCGGRDIGVGDVEYFVDTKRTGPRPHDNEGVWTFKSPPCEVKP